MAFEETKEQQQMYSYFRSCIYIFLIIEIVMNLPVTADNRVTQFILDILGRFKVFNSVAGCKVTELVCICVVCIGTKAKKALKFNVRTMVIYPVLAGLTLVGLCFVFHGMDFGVSWMGFPAGRILYTLCSVAGTMLVHQGLDGIARYYNYKVGEDRFNFENESFQQSEVLVNNDYSVNIPMIYYWKQKMHRGWINIINPFRGTIVLGTPGSGKSFSAKREIANVFLVTDDDIIICDPESEYGTLVERLRGQVIHISPTSTDYVNPMDLNLNYSDDESPLSLKSDFILSLCELIVGGKEGLQPVEKTIIDRCVRNVYREYLSNPTPEKMPILEDLYDELRRQEEKEAQYIATALEIYVSGSLNVFNHRTNINIANRIVSFDIKELGKQLKKIGMLIVQDAVWNRVTVNREAHKSTRYYIDEMHLLLREEQTAAYTVEIWKRFRKWGGIPTGITQNVKDLLSSREVENIFENSDFILMLNQASGDRQILAKQLNISPHQLSYVTHSGEGEGLLFYGNVILPFVDRFPRGELYDLLTTKPQEQTA